MTLHFCAWDRDDGPASIIVDANDDAHARRLVAAAVGEEPDRCLPWATGVFMVEVSERPVLDDDGDEIEDETEMALDPWPHVVDVIDALEANQPGTAIPIDAPPCGAEGAFPENPNVTIACILVEGHDGDHRGSDGEVWGDDG